MTDRVEMEGYKNENGSLNMLYVSEYEATPASLLWAKLSGYDISKNADRQISNESVEEIETRNKIMRDNSLDIATMVAYNKAGKQIDIKSKQNITIQKYFKNYLLIFLIAIVISVISSISEAFLFPTLIKLIINIFI